MDVAIVGAGPVGATLALLASGRGLDIALFEARTGAVADRRILALSEASRACLEDAGAWPAERATPITSIHVSQRGGPGRTLIEASDAGLPALGWTLTYADLQSALDAKLASAGVEVRRGESCEAIALLPEAAHASFSSGGDVRAKLLVLADGGANSTRIPGIGARMRDYGQVAISAIVATDRPPAQRAFERFTPSGPVALLPLGDRFALVRTALPGEAERIGALDDAGFLAELQDHFGGRAGTFLSAGPRTRFPLALRVVNARTALRTAIIGNAAQALHPIAGQGLNLGLRDAAELAARIVESSPEDLGSETFLRNYGASRDRDARRAVVFTDALTSLFADSRRLPSWGRAVGLTLLDLAPRARGALAGRMIRGAPAP